MSFCSVGSLLPPCHRVLQPATEAATLDTVCSLDSMAIAAEKVDAKMVELLPEVDEGVLPVGTPMAATPTTSIAQFLRCINPRLGTMKSKPKPKPNPPLPDPNPHPNPGATRTWAR